MYLSILHHLNYLQREKSQFQPNKKKGISFDMKSKDSILDA